MQYAVCSVQCAVCSVQCAVCSGQRAVGSAVSIQRHFRTRSWYPARVLGVMDLPQKVIDTLGHNPSGAVVVKRFIFDDMKVIKPDRLQVLGENRVDKARAAVSPEIGAAYDLALATSNGDI